MRRSYRPGDAPRPPSRTGRSPRRRPGRDAAGAARGPIRPGGGGGPDPRDRAVADPAPVDPAQIGAERADRLADGLAETLLAPLEDPFAPEVVAVPTRGIERWLTQRLSIRLRSEPNGPIASPTAWPRRCWRRSRTHSPRRWWRSRPAGSSGG